MKLSLALLAQLAAWCRSLYAILLARLGPPCTMQQYRYTQLVGRTTERESSLRAVPLGAAGECTVLCNKSTVARRGR